MLDVEEVLAVVAGVIKARGQRLEHTDIRVLLGGQAHFLEHRGIEPQVVVFDVDPRHTHRAFEQLVGQHVAIGFHRLDNASTYPFTQRRELTEPAVHVGCAAGGDDGGDFLVLARRQGQPFLEIGAPGALQFLDKVRGNHCHDVGPS
ncbi:hypothetical protein D3C84_786550 [compost metagenome]